MAVLDVYYVVTSFIFFWTLDKAGWFRVAPKDELTGLDEIKHKEKAYDFCKSNFASTQKILLEGYLFAFCLFLATTVLNEHSRPWLTY